MASSSEQPEITYPSVIELNVGGCHFTTTLMTLTKQRDTMLGAMFSGMHNQPQDKDGRYFIDADGNTFEWILSYLRTGELPPSDVVERVYHAALYFGLQDLAAELEYTPKIMAQQMKEKHHTNLENFDMTTKSILSTATSQSCITSWPRSRVYIAVSHKDNLQNSTDLHHKCTHVPKTQQNGLASQSSWRVAQVTVGPLQSKSVTEKVYMEAILEELLERGFSVQLQDLGFCQAAELNEDVMHVSDGATSCGAKMYCILFSWK